MPARSVKRFSTESDSAHLLVLVVVVITQSSFNEPQGIFVGYGLRLLNLRWRHCPPQFRVPARLPRRPEPGAQADLHAGQCRRQPCRHRPPAALDVFRHK